MGGLNFEPGTGGHDVRACQIIHLRIAFTLPRSRDWTGAYPDVKRECDR